MKPIEFTALRMKVTIVMKRTSEETLNEYIVVKAQPLSDNFGFVPVGNKSHKREITFVCFKEGLLTAFEVGGVYDIHGDVEFSWGGTYLSITKAFDQDGKRLKRKQECDEDNTDLNEIPF